MNEEQLENHKSQLAFELEEKKWEFKKQEIEYLEAGQHLRSLNQILWQIPGITTVITGGLWYGVTTVSGNSAKIAVLLFVALVNLLTLLIIWRLRSRIQLYIDIQNAFSMRPTSQARRNSVVTCWSILLVSAAVLSFLGAWRPESFQKASETQNNAGPNRTETASTVSQEKNGSSALNASTKKESSVSPVTPAAGSAK